MFYSIHTLNVIIRFFFSFWGVCVKWTENIEKDSQISLAKTEVTPAKEVCSPVLMTVLLVTVQRVSTAIFKNLSIVCACISATGVGDLLKADGIMNTEMYYQILIHHYS